MNQYPRVYHTLETNGQSNNKYSHKKLVLNPIQEVYKKTEIT